MQGLIDVFRMEELSIDTRIRVLRHLRELINCQYGGNVAEPIVEELVGILEQRKLDMIVPEFGGVWEDEDA